MAAGLMALPVWLAEHIRITTGDEPGGRYAHTGQCSVCGSLVISGPCRDRAAYAVAVDPEPVGPVGEALARLGGRFTFAFIRKGPRLVLDIRDHWQIGGGNRSVLRFDIVAEHRCGETLPHIPSVYEKGSI